MELNLAYIGEDFTAERKDLFDPGYMRPCSSTRTTTGQPRLPLAQGTPAAARNADRDTTTSRAG